MKKKETSIRWILLFGSILLLSQSNLFLAFSDQPSFLGFPNWLWFMVGVQLIFVFLLFRFTKTNHND